MFEIGMLPANHGDCLWIEYGSGADRYRILVDGGPGYAYDELKTRLLELEPSKRRFELLIVTHVDADHIGGILELLDDTALGVSFGDVWFNGWRHLAADEERASTRVCRQHHSQRRMQARVSRAWEVTSSFSYRVAIARCCLRRLIRRSTALRSR